MLQDLDLPPIFSRIDVETERGTDLKQMIAIVRGMIHSQREAAGCNPVTVAPDRVDH